MTLLSLAGTQSSIDSTRQVIALIVLALATLAVVISALSARVRARARSAQGPLASGQPAQMENEMNKTAAPAPMLVVRDKEVHVEIYQGEHLCGTLTIKAANMEDFNAIMQRHGFYRTFSGGISGMPQIVSRHFAGPMLNAITDEPLTEKTVKVLEDW